MVFVCDF